MNETGNSRKSNELDPETPEAPREGLNEEAPRVPFEQLNAGGHTGECPYGCPVCAAIGIVKQMSPEVSSHLAAAAREFMLAAKAFLDGVSEKDPEHHTRVERIPLD